MTVGAEPEVSVVIPTYQRRESVVRALAALAQQELPPERFEVIVSVDGSTDGTLAAVEAYDAPYTLRAVGQPHAGRAAACNAALALARGEVIVILDDDMEPTPPCLSRHRRHHPAGSRVCVMGAVPVHLDALSPPVARYVAWKFDVHLAKLARSDHAFVLRDFYSGNASVRRDVLFEVGLFYPGFTLYGNEDIELSLRLREAEVELRYDAEAAAVQHYVKSLVGLAGDSREKGHTAVLLTTVHPAAFNGLQLAEYGSGSRPWRALRLLLVAATLRWPVTSKLILTCSRLLERAGLGRRPYFYVFLLDYFYWVGVAEALADAPASGELGALAADLRRGPIRLLLHR